MISLDPEFSQWLSRVRRDFHMNPELSNQEFRTTRRICEILEASDIPVDTFPDSPGAVALIQGGRPGPCLALRADIDALPIRELNPVPYRSQSENRMHACGHDANTAIMLGVARILMDQGISRELRGSVKFLFQPAEERINGAREMIRRGVLENPRVERVLAGHMAPDLDVGCVGIFRHQGYAAADRFRLTITGRGGHGGRPHETTDPIVCGAQFVTAVQTIVARNTNPTDPAVISVGKFLSGDVGNVIPETASLEGTIRTLSSANRDLVMARMTEMVRGLETAFNVRCRFERIDETPACNCDEAVSAFMHDCATRTLGPDRVSWIPPTMGSEDFAFFTRERPASIIRLGCRNRDKEITAPLHSPYFDIDEGVLDIGVRVFADAVRTYLS